MNYITPGSPKAPQLSEADVSNLSPADVNRARRLGQLEELLTTPTPNTAAEPLTPAAWERLSPPTRAAMLREYGPSINPTHH